MEEKLKQLLLDCYEFLHGAYYEEMSDLNRALNLEIRLKEAMNALEEQ